MPKVVGIFAVPGVQLLDVSAPLDVFAQANAECGKPFYTLRIIASESGPIRSSSGAQLLPDWIVPDIPERIDTLLVAGAPSAGRIALRTDVLAWLRAAAVQSKRYGSICTGAFILAATGLLKGRHLTTHWAAADALAEAYPSLAVDADALYVRDGKLRTGAGVTAGLDLALALVEEDLGREIARRVAAQLVMFFKRPGGQLQFSRKGEARPPDVRYCRRSSAGSRRIRNSSIRWRKWRSMRAWPAPLRTPVPRGSRHDAGRVGRGDPHFGRPPLARERSRHAEAGRREMRLREYRYAQAVVHPARRDHTRRIP